MTTKGDLINGAFAFLRISGITVNPNGDDISLAISILDDKCAELGMSYDIGYSLPQEYGASSTSDESGITPEIAGAIKKILALELAPIYKPDSNLGRLEYLARDGLKAIQNATINISTNQYPETLPQGSGNTWRYSATTFYPSPAPYDAESVIKGESEALNIDWSSYLVGDVITAVTYEYGSGIALSDETYGEQSTSALVSFVSVGVYEVCVTITSARGTNKYKKTYAVSEC